MSVDVIGDFLTVIRNAIKVYKRSAVVPSSQLKVDLASVLKEEGFIKDFAVAEKDGKKSLTIFLRYVDGVPAINEITRVSTPGRRYYENSRSLTSVVGGLGVSVLTTSSGSLHINASTIESHFTITFDNKVTSCFQCKFKAIVKNKL